MPPYGSQTTSNTPLGSIMPGDKDGQLLFNNEIPSSAQASLAVAIAQRPLPNGPASVSVQFECPGGIGSGVFQIQDADLDVAGDYTSIGFGGANPGTVATANMNASGVARVELLVSARFLRVLCATAPGAAITVRVRQQ
jgi:hypothetical protein